MTSRNAVVTGASSGVGRAVAIRLAIEGWNVAIVARREDALRQTTTLAGAAGARMLVCPCDLSNLADVRRMAQRVLERFGWVQTLVNAAGTNAPNRSLDVLSEETLRQIMETNLSGAYHCVHEFLPGMKQNRCGTIVNVVSDAGLRANAKAGPAYVMSKFGMTGLTQSINAEERANGIRACAIYPGDIDTPLLEKRPTAPSAEARAKMLQPDDVAECVMLAINLPARAIVEDLVIRPAI